MTLFRYIPFVGGAFAALLGFLTFFCACSASIVVIAVAWVAYRPFVGLFILAVGIGLWVALSCSQGTCPFSSDPTGYVPNQNPQGTPAPFLAAAAATTAPPIPVVAATAMPTAPAPAPSIPLTTMAPAMPP